MRVNVYKEELPGGALTNSDIDIAWTRVHDKQFCGVRFYLKSASELHHSQDDDDRSAVTFWLGTPEAAHDYFQKIVELCATEIAVYRGVK